MEDANIAVVLIALYFLPTVVAVARGHHNSGSISLVNLLLGWTFIGWVVALVWSVSAKPISPSDPPPRS